MPALCIALAIAFLTVMLSGCAVVTVVDTAASVAGSAVGATADVAGAAVHTVAGSDDEAED